MLVIIELLYKVNLVNISDLYIFLIFFVIQFYLPPKAEFTTKAERETPDFLASSSITTKA